VVEQVTTWSQPEARRSPDGSEPCVPAFAAWHQSSGASDTCQDHHGGRTYRRIPDDFDQVQRQAGQSASVIADHYGVPRHTAYSWIRSARKKDAATN
jgi:hypothetical protein